MTIDYIRRVWQNRNLSRFVSFLVLESALGCGRQRPLPMFLVVIEPSFRTTWKYF
jgi:hypothetical protein